MRSWPVTRTLVPSRIRSVTVVATLSATIGSMAVRCSGGSVPSALAG
jgi:hypothetical protein